jgi:hypothetical protein
LWQLERQIRAHADGDSHEDVRAEAVAIACDHLQSAIRALEMAAQE